MLIGILGGLVSGLFGLGGGAVFVPLLVYLRHYDIHLAIGTSLAVVVPTAVAGCLKHGGAGMIDWRGAVVIAVFAILGAWAGASLSLKLSPLLLRRLFALMLIGISLKLFFQH